MHGSAARGIAIPFAPSSLLPCTPSRSRSFARSLACSQTLRASSHLFQPSSLAIPVILLAAQVSILAFSLFLSLSLSPFSFSLFLCFSTSLYLCRSPLPPPRKPADTRTHAEKVGRTASRKLNSRQRVRRACSQLCGASGTKLNDRGVFRLLRR